ncbi:MAG: hypothetical protein GTO16_00935, partial [Candidatus Aminicenantes bacterium]|nr:hypothetical protein [Candidatus Aminicenantes bacterium]
VAYLVMSQWLRDFAYKVSIGPLVYCISGVLTLIIALLTVSYQSIKAATANPVDSLRYE